MKGKKPKRILKDILLSQIDRNPENPRIFFRQNELDELTESIRRYGVQVPIAVYKEGGRYILIDGERRWRCCLKLNKKVIPAIIQNKPDAFTNLILMFNIHALREQWDLLTIALKLPRVIKLYTSKYKKEPNERQLSEETSLTRSVIRRCKLLMELPGHHIDLIKNELKKPKVNQRLSEDFYIEMERALTTVARAMPKIIPNKQTREKVRQILLKKYQNGIIKNIIDLRNIARMARASNVDADTVTAQSELKRLFEDPEYTIDDAYSRSVSGAYIERNIRNSVDSLMEDLKNLDPDDLDEDIIESLSNLIRYINTLLKR